MSDGELEREIASESAPAAAVPDAVMLNPLAALMTRHVLRDGEVVILMLRPSLWFIPFVCLRFAAVVLILMINAQIFNEQLHWHARLYNELGVFLLFARLMVAILQWLGRLYILTDMRVVQMVGVFAVEICECPLRKIGRVRVVYTLKERLLRLGSVEIIPFDDAFGVGLWQTVAKPKEVHLAIMQAIRRAKQGG
ncbi:MAG TPA: PH domain-containing protein [Tepidisphaeraceae bacterium]|jgi:hypothetical protein|nr:PH domain-containing protein [Tepidisphaeraceae bacterium]